MGIITLGFAAQTSSAVVILASSHVGFALSTTHVCSGGVMGSGLGREPRGVRSGDLVRDCRDSGVSFLTDG